MARLLHHGALVQPPALSPECRADLVRTIDCTPQIFAAWPTRAALPPPSILTW
jgi:hypothetical protein